jgi:O-antigen/teichoic acid export membrane protein
LGNAREAYPLSYMSTAKTMTRHAAEGFAITFVGDALNKVLGIITTFVILAVLAPYDYGIWRLLQSALSFMSIIALSGITGVVVADIARELGKGNKPRAYAVLWRALLILMSASGVATILLVVAAPFVSAVSKINLTLPLIILALSLLFVGAAQVLQILFQARLEPKRALILKNAGNVAYLLAIVLLVPYLGLSVLGVVIAYVLAACVPVLMFLPYIMRELRVVCKERDRASYSLKEVLLHRGGFALATDYATVLESALWPWIVGYFLSIEQVAYAGLAIVIASQVYSTVPLQYVLRGILPRFTDDPVRMEGWITRAFRHSLWLHLASAVAILTLVVVTVPLLFPAYAVAVPLVALLLIAVPFRAVGAVAIEWLYAVRDQRAIFISTALPRLLFLAALPFLLLSFGMTGFVLWYLGSSVSIILVRFALAGKRLNFSWSPRTLLLPDVRDKELLGNAVSQIRSRLLGGRVKEGNTGT